MNRLITTFKTSTQVAPKFYFPKPVQQLYMSKIDKQLCFPITPTNHLIHKHLTQLEQLKSLQKEELKPEDIPFKRSVTVVPPSTSEDESKPSSKYNDSPFTQWLAIVGVFYIGMNLAPAIGYPCYLMYNGMKKLLFE